MNVDDAANDEVYIYDDIYQLTNVDYADGNSTNYWYDALNNWLEVDDGSATSFATNNLNQYTWVGVINYSYDNNGNLIDDGTYKYYYDCENRLTDVNDVNDDPVASYSYDYLGRRVKKTIHDSQTTIGYCYDGDQVIAEYNGSTLVRKFIYGPGIDEPICMIDVADSNAVYYYHFDGLGSVAALSNNSGVIVERYSYDVFGEPNRVSDVNNPYFFTGRRLDTETDNYYYRARYYRPDIGRFLQTDPISYAGGLNLYTYCGNNPINWIDPYGLNWFDPPRPRDNFWGPIWDAGQCARELYHAGAAVARGAEGYLFLGLAGLAGIPPGVESGNPTLDTVTTLLSPLENFFGEHSDGAFAMHDWHKEKANGLLPRNKLGETVMEPINAMFNAGEDFAKRELSPVASDTGHETSSTKKKKGS